MDEAAVKRAIENGKKCKELQGPNILIVNQVKEYLKKRNYPDNGEVDTVIVFDKNKDFQIIQSRDSGDIYLIILKK